VTIRFDLLFPGDLLVDDLAECGEEISERLRDLSFFQEFSLVVRHDDRIVFDELPLVPLDLLGQLLSNVEPFLAGQVLIAGEEEESWMFYTDGKVAEFVRGGFEIYSAYSANGEPFVVTAADFHDARAKDELFWSVRMDLGSWLEGLAEWGSQFVRAVEFGHYHLIEEAQREARGDLLTRTNELFLLSEELAESYRRIRKWLRSRSASREFLEVIETYG
jgi:hypothetical protein